MKIFRLVLLALIVLVPAVADNPYPECTNYPSCPEKNL